MRVVVQENISQDGICYYLTRARRMSVVEAVDVLIYELRCDAVLRECWGVSLELLHERVKSNPRYDWQQIDTHCHYQTPAVICYLLEIPNVSRRMNHFCRQALAEPASWDAFPYKGIWFFLVLTFQSLPSLEVNDVFRGVSIFTRMPDYQAPAVQFLSASLHVDEAERFALPEGLLLTIKGVFMYYIRDVSFYATEPGKKNVLIWPFVTFTAGDVQDGRLELVWLDCMPRECEPRCINECHPH